MDAADGAGNRSAKAAVNATTSPCDSGPPTTPTGLAQTGATETTVSVSWNASTDDVGVAGYSLYRNGTWSGTLYQAGVDLIGTVMYDRLTGRIKSPVTYELKAFDAAGNYSAPATLLVSP